MYFFDMADYVNAQVIGCNNADTRDVGDWEDLAGVAQETRNAFLKAFNEWYLATRAYVSDVDCTAFDTYYDDIINFASDSRWSAFWTNVSTSLTREIWDDYLALWSETMCKVQELMRYLDGDTFEAFTP